ncbi:MAG TPA: hypothetical protein VFT45_00210 [Longimicrobium sp.]|nr:hypothetical protein [Longimicrobium sp.]
MIPIHTLTGPARECTVPRELRFDLRPAQQGDKPLWTVDEALGVIDALEEAGAVVCEGEIVLVSDDGGVSQLPWEPWLRDPEMQVRPLTRRWHCDAREDEAWDASVARGAAYARTWLRELAGEARGTPQAGVRVDLSWATRDELALFDVPGWERRERRRLIDQGGGAWEWMYTSSWRMRRLEPMAPGSYFGAICGDVAEIPADARLAHLVPDENLARLAELTSLEVLHTGGSTTAMLPLVGRLPRLRELFVSDIGMVSLEPLAGLSTLEFAYFLASPRLKDLRPLCGMPALRYLFLDAGGLSDLSAVAGLTQLVSLHLLVGKSVDSLEPLGGLHNLRHLSVFFEEVRDGSLAPLGRLRGLRSLALSGERVPLEEFTRLAVALPDTEGTLRSPFLPPHPDESRTCSRCGRRNGYVTVGRRRVLCPRCDARAIRRHVIRWEILLSAAAAARTGTDASASE